MPVSRILSICPQTGEVRLERILFLDVGLIVNALIEIWFRKNGELS